jgi:excisionase family DNA binding protein
MAVDHGGGEIDELSVQPVTVRRAPDRRIDHMR